MNKSQSKSSHLRHWEDLKIEYNLHYPDTDKIKEFNWGRKYQIVSESFGPQYKDYLIHSQFSIYTDGSKTRTGTGAGFVVYNFNQIIYEDYFPLIGTTTIFQAEAIAIKEAAKYLTKRRSLKPKYIKIFSDSRAVLQALNSNDITSSVIMDTIHTLNTLGSKTKRLTLNWIKAHQGHEGNEIADRLANIGARAKNEQQPVPVSDTLVKSYITNCIYDTWGMKWKTDSKSNKHTKHFFPLPNSRLSKRLLKFDRQELHFLVEAITGHNYLKHFSNKIALLADTKCRLCKSEEETTLHLLNSCSHLNTYRHEILNNRKFTGQDSKWNPVKLIEFLNLPQISPLFKPPKSLLPT